MPHVQRRALVLVDAPREVVERAASRALPVTGGSGCRPLPGGAPIGAGLEIDVRDGPAPSSSEVHLRATTPLAVPYFRWFVHPLLHLALRRGLRHAGAAITAEVHGHPAPAPPRPSPVLPTVPFTPEQASVLATVGMIAALCGFGGALVGQNVDFVADSFGVSNDRLGVALAVTRLGVLVGLVATALADRRGRRRLVLVSVSGLCLANAVSAAAPGLAVFTGAQFLTRGFLNAAVIVAAIVAVEEAPEGARAFSLAMLSLAGGAGFALAVVLLPLGDLGEGLWRIPFLLSAASALLLPRLARRLPETGRYERLVARGAQRGRVGEVLDRWYGPRFVLLAAVAFLANVLAAPAAQFTNRFLADERGYSGLDITLLRSVTNGLPGVVGVIVAGRLAERLGRRPTAAVGLAAAALLNVAFFLGSGPVLWVASTLGIVAAACGGLALGALDAELFPTEVRGTSNALLLVFGVAGSAAGLLLAGWLSDPLGGLGPAIALLAVGPVLAAVAFVPRLPESAMRRLDDVSPPEA